MNKLDRHISHGIYRKRRVSARKEDNTTVNSTAETVNDSRIIKLQQLQEHLQIVAHHVATCSPCEQKSPQDHIISVREERRQRLASILTTRCAGCHTEFSFSTSVRVSGPTGGQYWESNLAAVWGQMSTGGGHAPLQESMATLGVPTMTK